MPWRRRMATAPPVSSPSRVLRPGGRFLMMEHREPTHPFVRFLYQVRLATMGSARNRSFARDEVPFLCRFFRDVKQQISPTGRSKLTWGVKEPAIETISGTIKEIKTGPCERTTGRSLLGVHLIVEAANGKTINVHLGPAAALENVLDQLSGGQTITFEAFRTDVMPEDAYVAKSLTVSDTTFDRSPRRTRHGSRSRPGLGPRRESGGPWLLVVIETSDTPKQSDNGHPEGTRPIGRTRREESVRFLFPGCPNQGRPARGLVEGIQDDGGQDGCRKKSHSTNGG